MPGLYDQLIIYTQAYEAEYGQVETPQNLIPFMIEAFIQSDNQFRKVKQQLSTETFAKGG